MKKFLIGLLLGVPFLGTFVFAASYPDSFQVEVNPTTFQVNQPVDVKVTAIKDGKIMKDYEGSFSIYVTDGGKDGKLLESHEATVPEGGWGSMKLENQGVVPYTQGLILKKPGNFVVFVSEFTDDTITGSASITVTSDTTTTVGNIEILYPAQSITEEESQVSVMANAPEYANSRIQIYLNNALIKEGTTDESGILNEVISVSQEGTNTLELRAVNAQGETVAASKVISFTYNPLADNLLNQVLMTPNQNIKIGDKVRFEVSTDDRVSSAKLYLSGEKEIFEVLLDKEGDGYFSKDYSLPATGSFSVDAQLTAATTPRLYTGRLHFDVSQNVQIVNLKIYRDDEINGLVHVSWDTDGGDSDNYVVLYWEKGVGSESSPWQEFSREKKHDITLAPGRTYEFRVYATDEDYFQEGVPSDVIEFEYIGLTGSNPDGVAYTGENAMCGEDGEHCAGMPPTCVVGSIKFTTEKIGNKYYLVWSPVENVVKYLIYRSDFEDGSDKKFVGETELTRFEYPFDSSAKENVYAYYSIEAICTDGQKVVVSEVNKVQVGPFEDIMLILISTLLLYFMYRVYTYRV